jgi:hypothetical protein
VKEIALQTGTSNGVTLIPVGWKNVSNINSSGEFIEYNSEGGSIIYTISIEDDFDYKLKINKVMNREYGSVQFLLDNKPLGTLNCSRDIAISIPSVQEFSTSSLTRGSHKITLKFKDNIKIGIEKISLIKTQIPIKEFLLSQSFPGFIGDDGRNMHPIGNKKIVWKKPMF